MALYFSAQSGYFAEEPIQVQIDASMKDGYPPHPEHGSEWKERMMLRDFLSQVFTRMQEIDIEERRIRDAFRTRNSEMLQQAAQVYERLYKKTVKERLRMSHDSKYRGFADPFRSDREQQERMAYQRAMMQAQAYNPTSQIGLLQEDPSIKQMHKEALRKEEINKKKKKRDDDLYYLTT